MSEPQEVSPQVESPNASVRCIQSVSRRHSLDYNGSIVSSGVSEARTPRPATTDTVEEVEQAHERKHACLGSCISNCSSFLFFR